MSRTSREEGAEPVRWTRLPSQAVLPQTSHRFLPLFLSPPCSGPWYLATPLTTLMASAVLLALFFLQVLQNMTVYERATLCRVPWYALRAVPLGATFISLLPSHCLLVRARIPQGSLRAIALLFLQACLPHTFQPWDFDSHVAFTWLASACLLLSAFSGTVQSQLLQEPFLVQK